MRLLVPDVKGGSWPCVDGPLVQVLASELLGQSSYVARNMLLGQQHTAQRCRPAVVLIILRNQASDALAHSALIIASCMRSIAGR